MHLGQSILSNKDHICTYTKADERCKVLCSPPSLDYALGQTNALVLGTTGLDLRQQVRAGCANSQTRSLTHKPKYTETGYARK